MIDKRRHIPSTAAITTLNIAVSVAVVILTSVTVRKLVRGAFYALNINFPLLESSRPSRKFRKTSLEVITTCANLTSFTIIVLRSTKSSSVTLDDGGSPK